MKNNIYLFTLLLFILLINSCNKDSNSTEPTSEDNLGSISGSILDSEDQAKLSNVVVTLTPSSKQVQSDPLGQYIFDKVQVGNYNMKFSRTGYQEYSASISVEKDKNTNYDCSLIPSQTVFFTEGFESYESGKHPFDWGMPYSGPGTGYQVVSDNFAHAGNKSIHMMGDNFAYAVLRRSMSNIANVINCEAWVYANTDNNNSTGSAGLFGLANISLNNEVNWRYGNALVELNSYDKVIYCIIGNNRVSVTTFNPKQWNKIRFKFDTQASTISVWLNDQLIIKGVKGTLSEAKYDSFVLACYKFGVRWYFDDLKMWY